MKRRVTFAAMLAILCAASGCSVLPDGQAGLADGFALVVTNPVVSAILLSVGLVAGILALNTPGFSGASVVSLIAFGLYFGGGFIAGYAEWWAVVLLAAGVGLLIGELFVPGFGILGVCGILCIALSLFFSSRDISQFLTSVAVALAALLVTFPFLSRMLLKSKSFQKIVLNESVTDVDAPAKKSRVNENGVALTVLRPSGTVEVDGERFTAVAQTGMIDKGEEIRIVYEDGTRVVVERLEKHPSK